MALEQAGWTEPYFPFFNPFSFLMASLMLTFVMVDSRSRARHLEVLCLFFILFVISYGSYFLHGSKLLRRYEWAVRNRGCTTR
ncbi:hypothetical protein ACQKWADRAFT_303530 [Trichoderma austrokoningii]